MSDNEIINNQELLENTSVYKDLVNRNIQVNPDEFTDAYDEQGSPLYTYFGGGVYRKKSRKISGQQGFEYYDSKGYLIKNITRYLDYINDHNKILSKTRASDLIQKEYNKQELKIDDEIELDLSVNSRSNSVNSISNSISSNLDRETALGAKNNAKKTNGISPSSTRLDEEINHSLRNQEMIRLDEAFPDVGIYETDPIDNNRKILPTAPAVRARQAAIHGERYQKEYILRTVHRLALRRVPIDQIAQMFNVTVPTVYKWLDELKQRLRLEASTLTITAIAGDTLSFYNEARALGLTIASTASKVPDRVRGMEVALKAEQDKHRFLQVAGFYDTAKLGRETMEDESAKRARAVINMTKSLLSGRFEQDKESDVAELIDHSDGVIL